VAVIRLNIFRKLAEKIEKKKIELDSSQMRRRANKKEPKASASSKLAQVDGGDNDGAMEPGPYNYEAHRIVHVDAGGKKVSALTAWWRSQFDPIDASFLAVFRIVWGLIMAYEGLTYVAGDFGKPTYLYYVPRTLYKYWMFEFCEPPESLDVMRALCITLVILGSFITIGFFYRTANVLYMLVFGWIFCLDMATYLNHFYLVLLLAFMLVFLPCNATWSIDALLSPSVRSATVPRWTMTWLHFELTVVYAYAGVAKMNADWLRAEPLMHWLPKRSHIPLLGVLLEQEVLAYFFSYGGLVYDLLVGFFLMSPTLMPVAFVASVFFHVTNKVVFNIGIFPWMMLGSMTLFFQPAWPRMVLGLAPTKLVDGIEPSAIVPRAPKPSNGKNTAAAHSIGKRAARAAKLWYKSPTQDVRVHRPLNVKQIVLLALLGAFLAQQVAFPLRHWTYPGDVAWNEYGHRFSWRMKLRDKMCAGEMRVYNAEHQANMTVTPAEHLSPKQWRKTKSRPELVAQFARYIAQAYSQKYQWGDTQVYADIKCQLNFRQPQQFVRPDVELSGIDPWQWPYPFLTELEPLADRYYADYPWNMPLSRVIDMVTLQRRTSYSDRSELLEQSRADYWGASFPSADDQREFIMPPHYLDRSIPDFSAQQKRASGSTLKRKPRRQKKQTIQSKA
jgi:HTTM domain/Vitamin K-dependent gamma-carboxylase, lumenal domain